MSGSAARVPGHGGDPQTRLDAIEEALADLRRAVAELERRTASLEARAGDAAGPHPAPLGDAAAAQTGAAQPLPAAPAGWIALLGRTLVALGGAFLLRAVTDAALLPAAAGVAAGLAYAAFWLVQCDRDAARGRLASAHFHGVAALLVAFPLIGEATARFRILPPPAGAAAIVVFAALGLLVARRRDLPAVAWLATLSAVAAALALLVLARDLLPFVLGLIAIAAAVEALALEGRFGGLRWPPALGLDVAALATVEVLARPGGPPEDYARLAPVEGATLELLLVALYATSAVLRTSRRRGVGPFDVVQSCLALGLGLGGAARILGASGAGTAPVALLALLLGASSYASAFGIAGRAAGLGSTFHLHATLGGGLVWAGLRGLLPGEALSIVLLAIGVAAGGWGSRDRVTLRFHSWAYLLAGLASSGMLAASSDALLAPAASVWRAVAPAGMLGALGAGAGYVLLARGDRSPGKLAALLPQAATAVLAGVALAGLALRALVAALGAGPGPGADPAVVAAARTAVLVVLALALAWASRRFGCADLGWLALPVLGLVGVKLLFEDLPHGRPATLFLALTLLGGALLATPRLQRR